MYSPKMKEDLISELYRRAKAKSVSMAELVDEIIRDALNGKGPKKRGKDEE